MYLGGAILASQAQPGIPPRFPDEQAEPSTIAFADARHTGTDAITAADHLLQAQTWDDGHGNVYLSWALIDPVSSGPYPIISRGTYQTITSNRGDLSDPDVVLAEMNGKIYANLVYVDGGQVQYEGYEWTGSGFNGPLFSRAVGNPLYTHEYPNIDANAQGLVAFTWQQTKDDKVTVNVASNSFLFPDYSFEQEVTFGWTYLAMSDILGNITNCSYAVNGLIGVLSKNPPKGLFEQTLHPDIAISEGGVRDAVVSNVFVRHVVDGHGLFSIVNQLELRQFRYDCPDLPRGMLDTLVTHRWAYSQNNVVGSPRIAASSPSAALGQRADVEIVADRTEPNCERDGGARYSILNYSKRGSTFSTGATLINPNYTSNESIEPVVTYYNYESQYVISWTGRSYQDGQQQDVWAVTMKAGGNFTNPGGGSNNTPVPAAHSRVNDYSGEQQFAPSIAGRHVKPRFGAVHLFVDSQQQQLSFRYSDQQAGLSGSGNGLRPAGAATPALLQAHPNPTEGATRIQLQLQPGERVQSVTVTDLAGRPVADLTPKRQTTDAKAATTQTLTWNAGAMPTGTYLIRAVTSKRIEKVSVTRQ